MVAMLPFHEGLDHLDELAAVGLHGECVDVAPPPDCGDFTIVASVLHHRRQPFTELLCRYHQRAWNMIILSRKPQPAYEAFPICACRCKLEGWPFCLDEIKYWNLC